MIQIYLITLNVTPKIQTLVLLNKIESLHNVEIMHPLMVEWISYHKQVIIPKNATEVEY